MAASGEAARIVQGTHGQACALIEQRSSFFGVIGRQRG